MNYTVILLAAGVGKRMNLGFNKVFLTLNNHPLITLSAKHFYDDPHCTEIVYVVNPHDQLEVMNLLNEYELFDNRCVMVCGGKERQDSVYNGLKYVTNDLVLIHDAARPFITRQLINSLLRDASEIGCAIPGVKVKDTIKQVVDNFVEKTLPRDCLIAVQTPQACQTKLIIKAHEKANLVNHIGTDEASLIEIYQLSPVKIIEGNYDNMKITTPEDINLAESLYPKYFK
jgi:2-C-methyl-D-erythritol 4-phosphate cytidylyltransferase